MNKKVRVRHTYRIDVAPEGEHEEYFDAERISHGRVAFDSQGNLLEEVTFDDFGNETGRQTYTYDENGKLMGEETMNEFGDVEEKLSYERDADGNILKKFIHYMDGAVDTVHYRYDDAGKLIRKTLVDDEGVTESEEIFEFDGENLVKEEKYEEGELVRKNVFTYDQYGNVTVAGVLNEDEESRLENEYDESGRRIRYFKYDENDKLIEKHAFTYDEDGNAVEIVEEDPYRKSTVKIGYDENKNAVSQQELNRAGGLVNEVQRSYDENGNIRDVRAVMMGPDGKPQRKYLLVYDYEFWD